MLIEGLFWHTCLPLPNFMSQRDITLPSTEKVSYPRKPIQVDQCWHVTHIHWDGLDVNPGQGDKSGNVTLGHSCPRICIRAKIVAIGPHVAVESLKYS